MNQDLKTTDGADQSPQWRPSDQGEAVDNAGALKAEGADSEKQMIFKGTFPENVFDEDEDGRRILAEQNYCPSFKMTLIAVIVLALLYLIFR